MEDAAASNHFDVIVLGTSLRESILAAAIAKSGRSVLHVDENAYYGGSQATLNLKELVSWAKQTHDIRYRDIELLYPASNASDPPSELLAASRHYNLSLCPTLVPAVSPFVDTLVRSGVAKYTGFKLLDAVAMLEEGSLKKVAAAKEEIFNDKSLSLMDKRKLMKFLVFAGGEFEESELIRDHGDTPFLDFVQEQFSLSGLLRDLIVRGAALSVSDHDRTIDFMYNIRKYLKATGRYGRSPFLLAQYGGIGEIIQGFCRTSAVFGGTSMLGRPVSSLTPSKASKPVQLATGEDETYTGDCLVRPVDASPEVSGICRAIIVLSKPISLSIPGEAAASEDSEESAGTPAPLQAENALFVIPPGTLGDKCPPSPVTILMAGEGTFSAPSGQYVLYMFSTCESQTTSARGLLEPCLHALLRTDGETLTEETQQLAVYYSERQSSKVTLDRQGEQTIVQLSDSSALSLAEICDSAVKDAFALFEKITGEQELFAANEDDNAGGDDE